MVKSVEQINRDLAGIEEQSQALAKELRSLYEQYLDELGKTAYQRLISVCYQLCTQAFPELFLKLSMAERDRLQRNIKEESKQLQDQLALAALSKGEDESSRLETALLKEVQTLHSSNRKNSDPSDLLAEELSALGLSDADLLEVGPPSRLPSIEPTAEASTESSTSGTADPELPQPDLEESQFPEPESPESESPESEPSGSNPSESESSASVPPESQQQTLTPQDSQQIPTDTGPNLAEPEDRELPNLETESQLPITLIQTGEEPLSPGMLASAIAAEADDDRTPPNPLLLPPPEIEADPQTPAELKAWQERLERRISQKLRRSSQAMTRLLEKSEVLNNQLPDGLLAAVPAPADEDSSSPANSAQRSGDLSSSEFTRGELSSQEAPQGRDNVDLRSPASPHILNLTLESAEGSKKKRRSRRIQIVAIYLRLSELEFEAPLLMGWRNKIRSQLQELQSMERRYRQKQQERSIAEAEAAWRSTWSNSDT